MTGLYKNMRNRYTYCIRYKPYVTHALVCACIITVAFQVASFAQYPETKLPDGVRTPEQILMEFDGVMLQRLSG